MPQSEVERIASSIQAAKYDSWVDGGRGVDALLGKQTREHKDLDVCIKIVETNLIKMLLEQSGYAVAKDETPTRLVMKENGHRLDLHLLAFDAEGNGIQNYSGGFNFYPAQDLNSNGQIGNLEVRCLSPELQIKFRQTYNPNDKSRHDVKALANEFHLPIPEGF